MNLILARRANGWFRAWLWLSLLGCGVGALAQEHNNHNPTAKPTPPKVFLDKSPKVVEYQLKRLSNAQLLLLEPRNDDAKYIPVHKAIVVRSGMSAEQRQQAAEALATLEKRLLPEVIVELLSKLDASDRGLARVANELTELLLTRVTANVDHQTVLSQAATHEQGLARRAALAWLIQHGQAAVAKEKTQASESLRASFLSAVLIVPNAEARRPLRSYVLDSLAADQPLTLQLPAIAALPSVTFSTADVQQSADLLSGYIERKEFAEGAVQSLLKLDLQSLPSDLAKRLADRLVHRAEATPAAQRTDDAFVDASQLIEKLLPKLPESEARTFRQRLREIAVRVVRIKTVEEEMRYDLKYFVAEAGKPIQILLQNEDLMPHNLVITAPGALKDVALAAANMPPDALQDGKQYVPALPTVLFATKMVQAGKAERLTFTAPSQTGEYPYVCTYPNHWMRMYGVMVVVDDVDAFAQKPVEPKDPIGNNRAFVKSWKLSDFADNLEAGLRGRNANIGSKIFQEATCGQCHLVAGKGGRVGPELNGILKRHQQDASAVLREILEPSHKIDAKYAAHSVLTADGQVYSGVIVAEDEKSISLVSNPEQSQPTVIQRDNIEEMIPSSKSLMPAALMDQFTRDEILELLAFVIQQ